MEYQGARERWRIGRAFDDVGVADGFRVLIEDSWPAGLDRATASIHRHFLAVAPSRELMAWFREDPSRFIPFARSYLAELDHSRAAEALAASVASRPVVTLLVVAPDAARSQAPILRAYLECLPHG